MRTLLLILSLVLSLVAATADGRPSHVYSVIFEATLGTDNRVDTLKVSKVIDPATGSTDPVDIAVPDEYIAAARDYLRLRTYPPRQIPFYTYLFYDPARPTEPNIDPR